MLRRFFLLLVTLSLISCARKDVIQEVPVPEQPRMQSSSVATLISSSRTTLRAAYGSYREGVIGIGTPVALFFYASWDPFSKQTSELIESLYALQTFPIGTYRVDFDASMPLRRQFTVVTQDTVVLVNGEGKVIDSLIHPTKEELSELLTRYKKQ